MPRGLHYVPRPARPGTSLLRAIPLLRPAAVLLRAAADAAQPAPRLVQPWQGGPDADPVARELANAEAGLHEAVRVYDAARREIGDANRTHTAPVLCGGQVVMPARRFTPERIRERKSAAFRLFNRRRAQLATARRRVETAWAAAGLPSLAAIEERAACAADVRASKRQPVHASAQAV